MATLSVIRAEGKVLARAVEQTDPYRALKQFSVCLFTNISKKEKNMGFKLISILPKADRRKIALIRTEIELRRIMKLRKEIREAKTKKA